MYDFQTFFPSISRIQRTKLKERGKVRYTHRETDRERGTYVARER